jgi:hypothetical protein
MTDLTSFRKTIATDKTFRRLAGDAGVAAVLELTDAELIRLGEILEGTDRNAAASYDDYLDAGMEDGCPNEDGIAPAPFDPEAQDDLDRHNAEFPGSYR